MKVWPLCRRGEYFSSSSFTVKPTLLLEVQPEFRTTLSITMNVSVEKQVQFGVKKG